MTDPKNQTKTKPAGPTRSVHRPEDTTREDHYQPMQMHLSAKQSAKTKSSTHLCITIRWSVPPPSYLSVTSGGGAAARQPACPVGGFGGGSC